MPSGAWSSSFDNGHRSPSPLPPHHTPLDESSAQLRQRIRGVFFSRWSAGARETHYNRFGDRIYNSCNLNSEAVLPVLKLKLKFEFHNITYCIINLNYNNVYSGTMAHRHSTIYTIRCCKFYNVTAPQHYILVQCTAS